MLIVVWYLIPGLFLFGVVVGQGFIEKFVVHLFQILVAKDDILPDLLRSTFAAEKLLLLCRILPRPGHSRNGCAYKITRPFPVKAYILLLLFYHNWPQATTSLLLSCEKVTQKHFHTAAPFGRQYESAFARSRGGSPSCQPLRFPAAPSQLRPGTRPPILSIILPSTISIIFHHLIIVPVPHPKYGRGNSPVLIQ